MATNQPENWSSMDDIIKYLNVSRETILNWINERNMPAHKIGRLWKFKFSEVDEWVRSGSAAKKSEDKKQPKREPELH